MERNDLVFEHGVVKNFLAAAVVLGLANASVILNDREAALRQAIQQFDKKKAAAS